MTLDPEDGAMRDEPCASCQALDKDQRAETERRERYTAAITEHVCGSPEGNIAAAEAAVAVADDELATLHRALDEERDVSVRAEAENVRLQKKIERFHDRIAELEAYVYGCTCRCTCRAGAVVDELENVRLPQRFDGLITEL